MRLKSASRVKWIELSHPSGRLRGRIEVPGSKSETNRLQILKALYLPKLELRNPSQSRDSLVLAEIIRAYPEQSELTAEDAGTAMRFATAFLAGREGEWTLNGSTRMRERPIRILVDALRTLGAQIDYLEKPGFPPLRIRGSVLQSKPLAVNGSVSSQYISALMMIGPSLPEGLELTLRGFSVSTPYIYLTARLMRGLGLEVDLAGDRIYLPPKQEASASLLKWSVEPDWTAASYWFAQVLLAKEAEIYLPGFQQYSLQGDSFVAQLFAPLGVEAHFIGPGFRLRKGDAVNPPRELNLVHNPDLAQTLSVVYAAQAWPLQIKGLQTLRIKETDRLQALQTELARCGVPVSINGNSLRLKGATFNCSNPRFLTYGDHRMALALAPLALRQKICLAEPGVIEKSYGTYWRDLEKVGFDLRFVDASQST